MANKPKHQPYGVWLNKEELEAMQKNKQANAGNKAKFDKTIKAMTNTRPVSNKDIIEYNKKNK